MDIEQEKERLSQAAMLRMLIQDLRSTEMLIVYFSDDDSSTHYHGIYSVFVPLNKKEDIFSSLSWDLSIGEGVPGSCVYYDDETGEDKPEYCRFGSKSSIEPLIISRSFDGVRDEYIEVSEEFRLFHNLYHDRENNRYIKIDDGNETIVIEMTNKCVKVRIKELKQFLAIKEMYLSVQFDCREYSKLSFEELLLDEDSLDGTEEHAIWQLIYADFSGFSDFEVFSRLSGKKLITPYPKSKSGLYGFTKEEPKKHVDFIIDTDDVGDEIIFNSNPDLLANNFGANPEAPHYLTSVHFKKEVLDKYYGKPSKYSVEDSSLRCAALWGLQIDNHHDDKVCVWLGDLGRDLPYEGQLYWRSYNIAPYGGVSETYFRRQIMAEFTDSDRPEHIFKSKYNELQKVCEEHLGWSLLLPLNNDDTHHFDCLRIPSTNEQNDFDGLVLGLTKVLIDSLNEKSLNKYIDETRLSEIKGSISKLEILLSNGGSVGYESHIQFLRKLQNLRSSSSAHRKGSNYKKIAIEFEIGNKDLITVFEGILFKSIVFLSYLIDFISSGRVNNNH